ncbi:MAG: rhomboid family intramembrane serine protease [Desulfohalobiaceae bacterium]|nr:rhomboid family intramembrane serine protease [Desulfohalobiaceae bacterium]
MSEIVPPPGTDRTRPDSRKVREWSLVLTARGISHEIRKAEGRPYLDVADGDRERAEAELLLYEEENQEDLEPVSPAESRSGGDLTFWILLLVALFYKISRMDIEGFGYQSVPWLELGSVNAWMVHKGEWWRLVTGLTLHGDPAHLVGNLIVGGIFLILLSREIGTGMAWFFGLVSGLAGNAINVMLRGYPHVSIGASTSVFGVVGILIGLRILTKRKIELSRRILPLPAGLGILALLGTGGENTDLGAHLFGFGSGLIVGLCSGFFQLPDRFHSWKWEGVFLGSSLGLTVFCWLAALFWGRVPAG